MRTSTLLALAALFGCARFSRPVPVDPNVNFAAHVQHDEIVLDRVPGARGGSIEAAGGFHWGASRFEVTSEGQTVANLTLTAPATVEVRGQGGAGTPVVGGIEPSWEDNSIRLTLRSSDDAVLQTSLFERTATGGGPPVLSRTAQSVIDVRGTYRAVLRDAKGGEVGWLRVKITPYAESGRIYDGILPADVGPGLAAAAAVALNSEISWIESHTLDVYRGSGGGPLQQSIPGPK